MEISEAPAFTRYVHEYLSHDEYRELQLILAASPEMGDVMPGTGGFRKVRWKDSSRGKGRRGGLRIIYYYFETDQQLWFMTLYGKNEASDLTASEKRALKVAIESERNVRTQRRTWSGRTK